jgi:acyl dehydratase
MEVGLTRKYFEDLVNGERLDCQPVEMTREEIVHFARRYDPQPFHVDEDRARESIFGGLIASSLHTLSACTRVVVDAQGDVEIISGVGMGEVTMHNPVHLGDRLDVEAWWTDLSRSRSRRDRGYATIMCKVTNQRGDLVIEYSYRYLVACRSERK